MYYADHVPPHFPAKYGDEEITVDIQSGKVKGEINLASELHGEMFEPLKTPARFREFRLHPDLHTLSWPNDADFAPEFLRDKLTVAA
jgi:hypothetical protein